MVYLWVSDVILSTILYIASICLSKHVTSTLAELPLGLAGGDSRLFFERATLPKGQFKLASQLCQMTHFQWPWCISETTNAHWTISGDNNVFAMVCLQKNSCLVTARQSKNEFYFVVCCERVVSELFCWTKRNFKLFQSFAVLHKNSNKLSWKTFWRQKVKSSHKNWLKRRQEYPKNTVACHIQWHA